MCKLFCIFVRFLYIMSKSGFYLSILAGIAACCLVSCGNSSQTTTTLSSIAQVKAFSLSNNAYPQLAQASFAIEERIDTGLIYNKDSIAYGMKLDSVLLKVTYAAPPSSATLQLGDTTIKYVYTDTVNLTKSPIYFTIISQDQKVTKTYEIRVSVHQIDPDLFTWESISPIIPEDTLPALPSAEPSGFTVYEKLFRLGNQNWAMVGKGDSLFIVAYEGDEWQDTYVPIPANSAVRGFGTVKFHAASLRERAMLIGGYDREGKMSNSRLNFEYSPAIETPSNIRVIDYADSRHDMEPMAGVAVVAYDDKLYRFGGIKEDGTYFEPIMYESKNEGLTWSIPDSKHNRLPETITPRKGMKAFVEGNYIILQGGYNESTTFDDAYRGKVASADWN